VNTTLWSTGADKSTISPLLFFDDIIKTQLVVVIEAIYQTMHPTKLLAPGQTLKQNSGK
jgi:hypothetical protein